MSSHDRPEKYEKYTAADSFDELDLEHDSDTTLASHTLLSQQAFPKTHPSTKRSRTNSKQSSTRTLLTWLRWGFVVVLQVIILLVLLLRNPEQSRKSSSWDQSQTETGGDINGLYIPTSHTYTLLTPEESKYVPNMTSNADRMEIRRNWDMLMPLGSGSVEIPDYEQHPMLGLPIADDPIRTGALFEASWTHALHCLYYTVDTYHQLVVSNKFGFDGERDDMHASHCFEYLRNQILCMSDMTLEGSQSVLDATGEGQAHMCRNREEAIKWIEERRVDDIQSIVGP